MGVTSICVAPMPHLGYVSRAKKGDAGDGDAGDGGAAGGAPPPPAAARRRRCRRWAVPSSTSSTAAADLAEAGDGRGTDGSGVR